MKKLTQSIALTGIALACALGSTASVAEPAKADAMPFSGKKAETGKVPVKPGIKRHAVNPESSQLTTALGKADLVVAPFYGNSSNLPEGFPTHSYCKQNPAGGAANQLVFYIKNDGTALAPASQAKIFFNTFSTGGGASSTYTANVTPISAGHKKYMSIPIPANCYKPGFSKSCHFRIVVDATYQVIESEEVTNNYADSYCVSPAG